MSRQGFSDNVNCFNTTIFNCVKAEERSEILAWLSPLEPGKRHQDIQTRRVDAVGDWLLQTQEYRNWVDGIRGSGSDNSALFCYGDPGVGKTYISSLVIDTLGREAIGQNAAVACFYFDFAAQEEHPPAAILGSVLKQVVSGLDEIPERIVKAFRDREKILGGQKLVLSEIVEILQDISASRCTFICIDALDECPVRHRVKLLGLLKQILQKSSGARIFLTGRPHIRSEVEKHFAGRAAVRSITPSKDDITIFLRVKLREDTIPDAMDRSLEEEIIESIPRRGSEIFLLVFLGIETILRETTIYRRRQRLSAVFSQRNGLDLGGAYEATLRRIKAQGGEKARLGMAALMWISHSRRPLRVEEICHALAIEIGSNGLNNDDIPEISTLIGCCHGLVTVDKGASTVRLIHFTLQEYLSMHPDIIDRAHPMIAEICLTYLNFQSIKGLSAGLPPHPRDTPFLEYASLYWGTHARMELSDGAKKLALELLDRFSNHISAEFLWESVSRRFFVGRTPGRKLFSALHCISYFGITEVANILIKMKKWNVNQRDRAGMTPLIWAAICGHEEVVKLLLQKKHIYPDQPDTSYGRTALSWAAENGHEGVVRLFLDPRFADPGATGRRWGGAPQAAVDLLLGRNYINPDSLDRYGRTPLSRSAEGGHVGVVGLLMGRGDVNPDRPDTVCGRTPLSWAAENGYEGAVELLLRRRDVSTDRLDKYGRTPLLWAAGNGHEGVVRLVLGRKDVNPEIRDTTYGQTPLSLAAENGREGVVKLLLGRGDVNPDSLDKSGRTPLLWAAGNGHEGTVKRILEREGVSPDTPDETYGQTPLSLAAEKGRERVVKLLLGRRDANPGRSDKYDRTPLWWAAWNGHEGIVELLLRRGGVSTGIPDTIYGQTPLLVASRKGHEGTVRQLLERRDVNPNIPDTHCGQTPLSWAAENGHEGVMKLLLQRGDVTPDKPNGWGRTPLSWAAETGHDGAVRLLLGRRDVNPDRPDNRGLTPLSWAVGNRHFGVVELLEARMLGGRSRF